MKLLTKEIIDKRRHRIQTTGTPCYVELGCGNRKRHKDAIGIDVIDYPGVDIVGDAFDCLALFDDESVDGFYSYHFLEHVDNLEKLILEMERCLKPGGTLEATVPHFSNPFYYSDPTHKQPFGLYTFSYFSHDSIHRRLVPNYNLRKNLILDLAHLGFKSYPPNYLRHAIKKSFEKLINVNTWVKEFYEENLSGLIHCYEISYKLHKLETPSKKTS